MKHLFNVFLLVFLLGCATSSVEAQSAKNKSSI